MTASRIRPIETLRLSLLPLQRSHAAGLFGALRQPEVHRFLAHPPPASVSELEARYARLEARQSPDGREHWLNWAVAERSTGALVGLVEATVPQDSPAPALLAFLFAPAVWGKGYASEACRGVLEELAGRFGARAVEATTDARNTGARKLLERLHFRFVEERDSDDIIGGEPSREVVYRLDQNPHPTPA